jgi:hypothetical protein
MDKKEAMMFIIILGLLLSLTIVSGFFYYMIINGFMVTSHVVSAGESDMPVSGAVDKSKNQEKDVIVKHEDLLK